MNIMSRTRTLKQSQNYFEIETERGVFSITILIE